MMEAITPLQDWSKICVSWESGHLDFSPEPAINRCVTLDTSVNPIFLICKMRELDPDSSELLSMSSTLKLRYHFEGSKRAKRFLTRRKHEERD